LPVNGLPWKEPEPEPEQEQEPVVDLSKLPMLNRGLNGKKKKKKKKSDKPRPESPKIATQKPEPVLEIPKIITVEESPLVDEKSPFIAELHTNDFFIENVEQAEVDLENSPDELSWHSIYNQMVVND